MDPNQQNPMMPIMNVVGQKAPISDQVIDRLQQRVAQAQLQGIQEQRQGLNETKARLEALRSQPQQKDLSALMAIGDMVLGTGGQYSQIYQYAKPKDQTKEIQQLEAMLTRQRMGLADDELGYLKSQFQAVKDANQLNKEDKPKADQFKVAGFGRRVEQAENVFNKLENEGYNRATTGEGLKSFFVPGAMQSSELKQQEQAERNFINAVLRRESGAAIADSEFESGEKQYFPRAGDSDEVIRQKAANRAQVFEALRSESGPAWDKVKPISPKTGKARPQFRSQKANQLAEEFGL